MDHKTVNRFVSTLAGAFRSFYIYNLDNKAFEEILQNLTRRFQDTQQPPQPITLTITNRSLLLEGEPVGYQDLIVPFASVLRNLGYKVLRFQVPIQSRHFFQFLHVLTGKDSFDSKNEKLITLIEDGEVKPISLVPLTANSYLLRLSDDVIARRLAPLSIPESYGGPGWIEKMPGTKFNALPDLYMWCFRQANKLEGGVKNFTKDLITATQQGYFPWERFLKLFPFPEPVRQHFKNKLDAEIKMRERAPTVLGHAHSLKPAFSTGKTEKKVDAVSRFSAFSAEEVKQHREYRNSGTAHSSSSDLDLMESLIKENGADFTFGFALLVRTLAEKNPVGVQEKALRLAKDVWATAQDSEEMGRSMSLLSSLRQQLTSSQNVGLTLFPLREAALESSVFTDMARYFLSLGKACLPGLINALDEEQDRSMRKKLCQLMTNVAREDGVDILIESMSNASSFLLRNLVMVLGEIRAPQATQAIVPLLAHTQKIVRTEAVRALCQINTNESQQAVAGIAHQLTDPALKRIVYQTLSATKYRDVLKTGTWN